MRLLVETEEYVIDRIKFEKEMLSKENRVMQQMFIKGRINALEMLLYKEWEDNVFELRTAFEKLEQLPPMPDLVYKQEYEDMVNAIKDFLVAHYG